MIYVSAMFVLAQLRSASKQHRRQPHDTGVAIGGGPRFGAWLDKPRLRHILDTAELGNEITVGRNHCEKISFGTKNQRKYWKYIVQFQMCRIVGCPWGLVALFGAAWSHRSGRHKPRPDVATAAAAATVCCKSWELRAIRSWTCTSAAQVHECS